MTINVRKSYKGCVELRDYVVQEAIRLKEPVKIVYNGEQMTLSTEDLQDRVVMKSPLFKSNINKQDYHLLGYEWKPDEQQY